LFINLEHRGKATNILNLIKRGLRKPAIKIKVFGTMDTLKVSKSTKEIMRHGR
jgi:hypothetical protein